MEPILHIAIPSPLRRVFDYLPSKQMSSTVQSGMRVKVPFGRQHLVGIIVAVDDHSELPRTKLKRITEVLDDAPLLSDNLFQLIAWAADYYQHPLGDVFAQALPLALRQGKTAFEAVETFWRLTVEGTQVLATSFKRSPKQWQLIQQLRELSQLHATLSAHELKALGISPAALKVLENKKISS
jgi:primosomal protein N' (replication factor Y)